MNYIINLLKLINSINNINILNKDKPYYELKNEISYISSIEKILIENACCIYYTLTRDTIKELEILDNKKLELSEFQYDDIDNICLLTYMLKNRSIEDIILLFNIIANKNKTINMNTSSHKLDNKDKGLFILIKYLYYPYVNIVYKVKKILKYLIQDIKYYELKDIKKYIKNKMILDLIIVEKINKKYRIDLVNDNAFLIKEYKNNYFYKFNSLINGTTILIESVYHCDIKLFKYIYNNILFEYKIKGDIIYKYYEKIYRDNSDLLENLDYSIATNIKQNKELSDYIKKNINEKYDYYIDLYNLYDFIIYNKFNELNTIFNKYKNKDNYILSGIIDANTRLKSNFPLLHYSNTIHMVSFLIKNGANIHSEGKITYNYIDHYTINILYNTYYIEDIYKLFYNYGLDFNKNNRAIIKCIKKFNKNNDKSYSLNVMLSLNNKYSNRYRYKIKRNINQNKKIDKYINKDIIDNIVKYIM